MHAYGVGVWQDHAQVAKDALAAAGMGHLPIHVNELNLVSSADHNAATKLDSFTMASAVFETISELLSHPEVSMANWAQFLESGAGDKWGVVTEAGLLKPSFHAFNLYARMPSSRKRMAISPTSHSNSNGFASTRSDLVAAVLFSTGDQATNCSFSVRGAPFTVAATLHVYIIDATHNSHNSHKLLQPTVTKALPASADGSWPAVWQGVLGPHGTLYFELMPAFDGSTEVPLKTDDGAWLGHDRCALKTLAGMDLPGRTLSHFQTSTVDECGRRCCAVAGCAAFTWTSWVAWHSTECPVGVKCCFLKPLAKWQPTAEDNCTSGMRASLPPAPPPRPPPPPTKGGGACHANEDCLGGGLCVANACHCDAMFTGDHCAAMDLLPVDLNRAGFPQPAASSLPTNASFPWGGALIQSNKTFHLFATEWLNHCPMRYDTFTTSTHIAHLTSAHATGPWVRHGVVVPAAAGNPAITRSPDGTFLLYFTCQRWTGAPPQNCSATNISSWGAPVVNPRRCASTDGATLGISLAYSTDLVSWEYQYNVISVPASNPGGPLFFKNGTLMLPFQTWPPGHPCTAPSCITIVTAPNWRSWPYNTYPLGQPGSSASACIERQQPKLHKGSVEDPSNLWRDARGTLHLLMHEQSYGSRAWSFDSGASWHYNYSNRAYPYSAETQGGGDRIPCTNGREEPRLLLDTVNGQPTVLSTLCKKGGGPMAGTEWTRVLLQRIRLKTEDSPLAAERRTPINTVRFQLATTAASKPLSTRLFGCNFEGYLLGVGQALANYRDAAKPSQATKSLASALRKSGCKVLRFPGGTDAQFYIPDSSASGMRSGGLEAMTLIKTAAVNFTRHGVGCFAPGSWSHQYYVRIIDFLQFCADFGFEPLWQLNPTFFVEPTDGKVHVATLTRWVVKDGPAFCNSSNGTSYRDPSLLITGDARYGPRFVIETNLTSASARSAAVLSGQLRSLQLQGVSLPKLYEIGNEDFAHLNYCDTSPYSKSRTNDVARYSELAASLAVVVRAHMPGSDVIVTDIHNQVTNTTTLQRLASIGALSQVYAATGACDIRSIAFTVL